VDWQPWDEGALEQARREDRPILLSIGYSACHWCHVMAHESFEDESTAEVMNRLFVNIKVDREERPDLDRIYQLAHQLLTGRGGGWPLTVFLDPVEQVPFFAGTYFPSERRYGMPAFREVLQAIAQWFGENRELLPEQNAKLRTAINSLQSLTPASAGLDSAQLDELLTAAAQQALARFDRANGGFGAAPKFPQAPLLEAVAMLAAADPRADAGRALHDTLQQMAVSGLRDHLDGGFFRYCVDADWNIPHFEKMLYDNAMLLPLYAEGARRWNSPLLQEAAEGIAAWLEQSMRLEEGAYAASIDADADGEEGGFHVWQRSEVESCLDDMGRALFLPAYGLNEPPNFEGTAWHLRRRSTTAELAQCHELDEPEVAAHLAAARATLWERRERRTHPLRDDKLLTSWNALLVEGLVRGARALGRDDWLDRAERIVDFIQGSLWTVDGLFAVHNGGRSRFPAYLDDYAYLLQAVLSLLGPRWSRRRLDLAIALAEALLHRFEDTANGGFYFSDVSVDVPVGRSMVWQDDATPAGNGIAVLGLSRLGHLLGESRYLDAARRCALRATTAVREAPLAHATLLRAVRDSAHPPSQLIVAGTDLKALRAMFALAQRRPDIDCYLIGASPGDATDPLPGLLAQYRSDRPASAWLCRGAHCLPPVHTAPELERLLDT